MVMGYSSYVNEKEKPAFMVDGDENTKWCAIAEMPHYVDFDLGGERSINGWKLLNAAGENHSYVTSSCFLQGKSDKNGEWRTLDYVSGSIRINSYYIPIFQILVSVTTDTRI